MDRVLKEKIRANIANYGQHVVCVGISKGDPADFLPFVYTIGNHQLGLPELLLIGQSDDLFVSIVNAVGEVQREGGKAFTHGERVDFSARLPALIVEAGQRGRDEYAVQAGVYYGTDNFEVRQILLPDRNGRFPGEAGCLPPYSDQVRLMMLN